MLLDTIQMFSKFYLIEKEFPLNTTSSWIFLTDEKNENFYKVVKAWPDTKEAKVGNIIVIGGRMTGDDIILDWKEYKIIWDHNVLAIIS